MSEYYETSDDKESDAPTELPVYKGMRSGDKVKYVGPMPLEGTFTLKELILFTPGDVLAIMADSRTEEIFEVNADNLEKL